MAGDEEHDGASVQEILIEACRRNNVELLDECLESKTDAEISKLLNETKTVMGNHLYHEAASRGNCAPHTCLYIQLMRSKRANPHRP
jgi:hypothetical protein